MKSLSKSAGGTPVGRGYIEHIMHYQGSLQISGWMCLLGHEFDRFDVYLNGDLMAQVAAPYDQDVHQAIGPSMRINPARFFAEFPIDVEPLLEGWHSVLVVGFSKDCPVAHIESLHRELLSSHVPSPPLKLRYRVTRGESLKFFKESAARSIADFVAALRHHGLPLRRERVLDWGCGCGRLAALARIAFETEEVYGCDIDSEAIAFCQDMLSGDHFSVIPPLPPTSCSSAFFDTVIGYSVCTHLTEEVQMAWIKELRRVTKPGGIVMLSVHGPTAFHYSHARRNSAKTLRKRGIIADHAESILEDQAPADYYRTTYQDPEWTKANWGKHFDIIGYHPLGMVNFHDLVVMRRP